MPLRSHLRGNGNGNGNGKRKRKRSEQCESVDCNTTSSKLSTVTKGDQASVLIVYHQTQIDASVAKMTAYAVLAVLFGAFQLALLGINFQSQEYIETKIFSPFHLGEFWAIFLFTLLEAIILTTSGALDLAQLGRLRLLYYGTMGMNIVLTFVAAVLLSMDSETFEKPAHFLEYCAQIPITLIDLVFVFQQSAIAVVDTQGDSGSPLSWSSSTASLTSLAGLASFVVLVGSILQLFAYTKTFELSIPGEQVAHFFEFPIEFVNACIALWFALRTRQALLRRSVLSNADFHC
jgi:hypothetical protein